MKIEKSTFGGDLNILKSFGAFASLYLLAGLAQWLSREDYNWKWHTKGYNITTFYNPKTIYLKSKTKSSS